MDNKNETLLKNFFEKRQVALAKIITLIENRADGYEEVLSRLFPRSRNAYRVGITGPPGAGKSTIVDKIALHEGIIEHEIGIVAVDPTSPFTGGAVLGDRIRMRDLATLPNVFIRSMASRGSSGGLAAATKDVLIAFDAFGKEYILIETVGVGQVELDVIDACDTVIVVLTPEAGDSVQALKAGLLEIADIFMVNKSDRPGADLFASELQSVLELKEDRDRESEKPVWKVPIIPAIATRDEGIAETVEQIIRHKEFITKSGLFESHRKLQIKHKIQQIIMRHIREIAEKQFLGEMDIDALTESVFSGEIDPYTVVREYFEKGLG